MPEKKKLSIKAKKDIMIAVLLTACLLLSVAVMILVEDRVGEPVFYDGEMKNIKVQITEVCSANSSVIANDNGDFADYIELYNGGETFNLNGFGLANDTGNSVAYTFGDVEFKADSYLIVYLDGVNIPFRLSSSGGEYVSLISYDGTVVASVTTLASGSDQVMILEKDGYTLSDSPSPGYPNTEEGVKQFLEASVDGNMSLVINEILTSNQSALPDFEGDFCDIIELKNVSASIVSTKGYYISDSLDERGNCPLPETELAPGDIMLIFASGKDLFTESGEFHANFRVSDDESVIISFGAKYYSQAVSACRTNCSLSRTEGENGIEYVEMAATPGFENNEAGVEALELSRIDNNAPLVINEVLLSQDETPYGGKLRDVIELCNVSDSEISTKGYYISDSLEEPYKYSVPERTLAPKECMIIYAEKGEGENVSGFALSTGESLYLTAPDFRRSELVSCASAGTGCSRIRVVENGEAVYVNGGISIGFENSDPGIAAYETSVRPAAVEISEAVASNRSYLAGPYGTYHDFAELHNRSSVEIDLSDYYLSDDPEEPRKGSLAGVKIPAGGYVIIILSSDGLNTPSGYHCVNFSLAASGETLTLSRGDFILDTAVIPSLSTDTAFGRADGSDGFSVLTKPTPNGKNASRAITAAAAPTASLPQGTYDQSSVTVELFGEGEIYYTLDCSEPTTASARYTEPLTLTETTVIRCRSAASGKPSSDICDLTYIINEPDTLETVSIVTTPENLWDYYTGIYETGPHASTVFPYEGANYYQRWEREATVSFFDSEGGGFSEKCGIRIFGGLSRALPKKSFSCFFRSSYGAGELNYQLFPDDELDCYEAFVLRNTGQDFRKSSMRDAMVTSLAHDELGIDVQNNRAVVVYINGEYWGIYFIREKLNENYVAGHYNVDASKAEVAVANGNTSVAYKALVNYAWTHDLSVQEHYDYVCSLMDVENYAAFSAAQMIIANTDNGNIRFFTYEGGKWRWIMYDVDQSFRTASYDTVSEHLNPNGTGSGNNFSTRLVNSLLKNPEFRKMFLTEIAYQLNNVWTEEKVNAYIDEYSTLIANDIGRDCQRWDKDYDTWVSSVESLRSFISNREAYVIKHVQSYFSLSDSEMREYGFNV